MSNIKRVEIKGWMPFDITQNEEARKWLGTLNGPSLGLRIRYGRTRLGPENKNGGRTTFYGFVLEGDEAVRFEMLERILESFKDAGCVEMVGEAYDLEEASRGAKSYDRMVVQQ